MKAPSIRIRGTQTIPRSFDKMSGVDIGVYCLGGIHLTEAPHVAKRLDSYVLRYGRFCGRGKVNGRRFYWILRAFVNCESYYHG